MRAADTIQKMMSLLPSNHWTIAKRHHHHTPGCLNDELQAELQLRVRVAITISQQIIVNTRSGI